MGNKTNPHPEILPIEGSLNDTEIDSIREKWESFGLRFGQVLNNCYVEAFLPEGWKKCQQSLNVGSLLPQYWFELRDQKGRKRAGIFDSGGCIEFAFGEGEVFYTHIYAVPRFAIEFVLNPATDGYMLGAVVDNLKKCHMFSCGGIPAKPLEGLLDCDAWRRRRIEITKALRNWLNENYPLWGDPFAYWHEGDE